MVKIQAKGNFVSVQWGNTSKKPMWGCFTDNSGERLNGIQEVSGSIPLISTNHKSDTKISFLRKRDFCFMLQRAQSRPTVAAEYISRQKRLSTDVPGNCPVLFGSIGAGGADTLGGVKHLLRDQLQVREYLGTAFPAAQDTGIGQVADDTPDCSVVPVLAHPRPTGPGRFSCGLRPFHSRRQPARSVGSFVEDCRKENEKDVRTTKRSLAHPEKHWKL